MLKKFLVSTILTVPLLSSVNAVGKNSGGIDALRAQCKTLEQNEQIKFFDKGLLCKGSRTVWKSRAGEFALPNYTTVDAETSYDKTSHPRRTPGVHVTSEAETSAAQCNIYDKYRVSAPQIPVFVDTCDELTAENVERLCGEAIKDHCFDAFDPFNPAYDMNSTSQQNTQHEEVCNLEKVGAVNSCDRYNH